MKEYFYLILISFNEFRLVRTNVKDPDFGCPCFVLSEEEFCFLLDFCTRSSND